MVDEVVIPIRVDPRNAVQNLTQLASIVTRNTGRIGQLASQFAGLSALSRGIGGPLALVSAGVLAIGTAAVTAVKSIIAINKSILNLIAASAKLGVAVGRDLTNKFVEFDDALKAVEVIGKVEDMKSLRNFILELGGATKFTATEIANLSLGLAKAGKGDVLMPLTEAVINLAQATGSDLNDAMRLVVQISNQFGKEGEELALTIDQLAIAATASTFDLGSLVEAMKFAGLGGAVMNASLEEVLATTAVLKDRLDSASIAGTGLQRTMFKLIDGSKKMNEFLKSIGLTQDDVNVKTQGLVPVIETLAQRMRLAGKGAEELVAVLGLRAGPAAAALVQAFSLADSRGRKLIEMFKNARGASAQMGKEMLSTLGGSLIKLASAWDNLKIVVGGFAGPVVQMVIDQLTSLVSAMTNMAVQIESTIAAKIAAGFQLITNRALGTTNVLEVLASPRFAQQFAKWSDILLDVGQAMLFALQIGVQMSKVIKVLAAVVELAAAGFGGMARALEILTFNAARLARFLGLDFPADALDGVSRAAKSVNESLRSVQNVSEEIASSDVFGKMSTAIEEARRGLKRMKDEGTGFNLITRTQEGLAAGSPEFAAAGAAGGAPRERKLSIEMDIKGFDLNEDEREKMRDIIKQNFARRDRENTEAINSFGSGTSIAQAGTGTAISGGD